MDCNRQILREIRIISYSSYQTHPACLGVALAETDCPSLFDENIKDIPKRRNLRKARRSIKRKNEFFLFFPSLFKRGLG